MIHRLALCLAGLLATQTAAAQEPECRLYKVTADSLIVSKDPRSDAPYTDVLDKATVVCLTREQKAGGRDWGYIPYKLTKPDQRRRVEGWANLRLMQPLSANEIAALKGASAPPVRGEAGRPEPAPPPRSEASPPEPVSPPSRSEASPPAPAPPAHAQATPAEPAPAASSQAGAAADDSDEAPRFGAPIASGPYPVNGHSIEELSQGTPLFPPFEGIPEPVWKKPCSSCHKWDRRTLCEQGQTYVKNPAFTLRHPHPYGGPFKNALRQWAKAGCQ